MATLTPMALPLIAMSGISLYVGLVNFLYYFSPEIPKAKRNPVYLYFIWLCLSSAAYDFFSIRLYCPGRFEDFNFWIRGAMISACVFMPALLLFIAARLGFDRQPREVFMRKALSSIAILAAMTWCLPDSVLFTGEVYLREVRVWSSSLTIPEVVFRPLGSFTQALGFIMSGFGFYLVVKVFLQHRARENAVFIFVFGLFSGSILLDTLIGLELISFIYTLEYAFLGIVLVMDLTQVRQFVEKDHRVREMNVQLSHAVEQAQESARIKKEFLAKTSHELRTPLNAIINLPDSMLSSLVDSNVAACSSCVSLFALEEGEEVGPETPCPKCAAVGSLRVETKIMADIPLSDFRLYLTSVRDQGRALLGIVNELLDISSLEQRRIRLRLSEVNLRDVIISALDAASELARARHIVIVAPEVPASLTLTADPDRLGQVLANLLSNAVKYSPERGRVKLALEHSETSVTFTVQDRGIGIPKEKRELIFAGFQQADGSYTRSYGGIGLGLAITRHLVELHQGRIWVESEEGKGSTFFVELPRCGSSR